MWNKNVNFKQYNYMETTKFTGYDLSAVPPIL